MAALKRAGTDGTKSAAHVVDRPAVPFSIDSVKRGTTQSDKRSSPWSDASAWVVRNPLEIVAGLMLVAIVLIVFAGVLFRYFLHIGLGWTEEAARFLLIWMTFVGATVAVRRWTHFQLAIVTTWTPRHLHRPLEVFAIVIVLVMAAILVRYGIAITRVSWEQTSPMMSWSMGYLYAIVPTSGAVMFLFGLGHLVRVLRGGDLPVSASHAPDPDEAPAAAAATKHG
jgi:TRAP-type C4-dicarboxylate transport system permease small subunit